MTWDIFFNYDNLNDSAFQYFLFLLLFVCLCENDYDSLLVLSLVFVCRMHEMVAMKLAIAYSKSIFHSCFL